MNKKTKGLIGLIGFLLFTPQVANGWQSLDKWLESHRATKPFDYRANHFRVTDNHNVYGFIESEIEIDNGFRYIIDSPMNFKRVEITRFNDRSFIADLYGKNGQKYHVEGKYGRNLNQTIIENLSLNGDFPTNILVELGATLQLLETRENNGEVVYK